MENSKTLHFPGDPIKTEGTFISGAFTYIKDDQLFSSSVSPVYINSALYYLKPKFSGYSPCIGDVILGRVHLRQDESVSSLLQTSKGGRIHVEVGTANHAGLQASFINLPDGSTRKRTSADLQIFQEALPPNTLICAEVQKIQNGEILLRPFSESVVEDPLGIMRDGVCVKAPVARKAEKFFYLVFGLNTSSETGGAVCDNSRRWGVGFLGSMGMEMGLEQFLDDSFLEKACTVGDGIRSVFFSDGNFTTGQAQEEQKIPKKELVEEKQGVLFVRVVAADNNNIFLAAGGVKLLKERIKKISGPRFEAGDENKRGETTCNKDFIGRYKTECMKKCFWIREVLVEMVGLNKAVDRETLVKYIESKLI